MHKLPLVNLIGANIMIATAIDLHVVVVFDKYTPYGALCYKDGNVPALCELDEAKQLKADLFNLNPESLYQVYRLEEVAGEI
jgi:hypothetical protein